MNSARVMDNGDLRLPEDIAARLNAKPGDALGVEADADGTIRLYPRALSPEEVLGGLSGRTTVRATIEEMDEAVAEAFRKGDL